MGFHLPQTLFMNLALVLLIVFTFTPTLSSTTSTTYNFPIAKPPPCIDRCGNISIPYPFGTTESCYRSRDFWLTCNHSSDNPPKLFLQDSTIEITSIFLTGQLNVLQYVSHDCYAPNGTRSSKYEYWMRLSKSLTVNNTANKFTVVGCDAYAYVYGNRPSGKYRTICSAFCKVKGDLEDGSCAGIGCGQVNIPQNITTLEFELGSYWNYRKVRNLSHCSYGFVADESAFNFSKENLTYSWNIYTRLPMVVDWAIGNGTCEEAMANSFTYACKGPNSVCYKPDNGYGYRCRCDDGYEGNPYLDNGCQDINECKIPGPPKCEYDCVNIPGGFQCSCPKGSHGDGRIGGKGCSRGESLALRVVAGTALGSTILLLVACLIYIKLNKKRSKMSKQKFFLQNGGMLLQEKLTRRERSPDMMKIFTASELKKATNDFDSNKIIGQGGFGTVYKGLLPDNRIVAIKKSKRVDPNQIEEFINEVLILSQINHRNAVKLLGCCLETEVPLLVYEFISNGTLSEHIHNQAKACLLNWDRRLKIAAETADVLSYLHSAASIPIIHRDVKSDNILLDHALIPKVSDFGASRLIPLDQTQLTTLVQGTFGYLDPEYLQTHQLTMKSDVYSFGVVMLELLTGRKAVSFDRQEKERNLVHYFLSILKQESLFQLLDHNIVSEKNIKQIMEVVRLAQRCVNVKGEDRPSMREVAMELEHLKLGVAQSWVQTKQNEAEKESLLGVGLNGITNGCGGSSSLGYESLRDHVISPLSGGR